MNLLNILDGFRIKIDSRPYFFFVMDRAKGKNPVNYLLLFLSPIGRFPLTSCLFDGCKTGRKRKPTNRDIGRNKTVLAGVGLSMIQNVICTCVMITILLKEVTMIERVDTIGTG